MGFINPFILVALVAAGIPLIIHLFNFRKPKRILYSSLAFLRTLEKNTIRRVKVRQWLLLALRTIALLALIIAFARPALQGNMAGFFGQRAQTSIAIIVDNSRSMDLRDANGSYLEQAKLLAGEIIAQTEEGDVVFILPTGNNQTGKPIAFTKKGPALDLLENLSVAPSTNFLTRNIAQAEALLENTDQPNHEIYLISDLQKNALADTVGQNFSGDARLFVLPVGERTYDNVGITKIEVKSRIIEAGQPVKIEATVRNFGSEDFSGFSASLYIEDERLAQGTANLPAGQSRKIAFTITPRERGWLSGLVQIEEDAFGSDNFRYFSLRVPEKRKTLIVKGTAQNSDFLTLALSAQLRSGNAVFDETTIDEQQLAAANLTDYDAVLLVGLRDLSTGEQAILERYISAGGGVLMFPSEQAIAADYNAFFQQLNAGTFSGFSGNLNDFTSIASFVNTDFEHILFEGMLADDEQKPALESPDIFYAMNYTPANQSQQSNENSLIKMSNGFPFLQEIRHGKGTLLLAATAPDLKWTDWPVRGVFIPLLYRSVYYLAAGEEIGASGLTIGGDGIIRVVGQTNNAPITISAPDQSTFTPDQRSLYGATLLQTANLNLTAAGIYQVYQNDEMLRKVALNLPSLESDLRVLSAGEAQAKILQETGLESTLFDVRGGQNEGEISAAISSDRFGVELWHIFLWLSLLFLVAEMFVSVQLKKTATTSA